MENVRKARVGEATVFWWWSPEPLSVAPSLVVRLPAGDQVPVLAAIHADLTVTAAATDRRVLTVSAPVADARGFQGDLGVAHLVTQEQGAFPVRVVRIDGATVVLADPLPRAATLTANATLEFAAWFVALSAANVTPTAVRDVPWEVTYSVQLGLDAPAEPRRDEGLLHIVRQPFGSGLTHQWLVARFPGLAIGTHRRQQDFGPQIASAQIELIDRLRDDLALVGAGYYEDDVSGRHLMLAHAYLARAHVLDDREASAEAAERARSLFEAAYEAAMKRIWVDLNRDGVVDAAEADTAVTAASASDAGGNGFVGRARLFTLDDPM